MKIVAVEPFVVGTSWRNLVFVRVKTDEGLEGVGECTLQNRHEGVLGFLKGAVRRHVLGSDPFNIEDLWLRMYRNDFWRGGDIALSVLSSIELACWDIVGKAVGQPVYRLLGGQCRDKVRAYANAWYTTARKPQEFARLAKGVVEKGYTAMKVDPFGPGALELSHKERDRAIDLVAAIREAVGPEIDIFIEMHGRFSAATAIEIARLLEPYHPGWIEEALPAGGYSVAPEGGRPRQHSRRYRGALLHPLRVPRGARNRRARYHSGRYSPFGRLPGDEENRRHGRCSLHGDGPAQLERPRLHHRQCSSGLLHAEFQNPGVLRRLLGALGARRRARNAARR